jgi:phospholipase C
MLMTKRLRLAAIAGAALGALGAAPAQAAPKHLFLIMMENHSTEDIFGNSADAPYVNALIKQPGVLFATQYFGVTHPSLPNYLALLSGSTQGIFDDCKAGADVTCKPEEFVPGSGDGPTAGNLLTDAQADAAARQPHLFRGTTLVDQLEAAGLSWKAYMQAMPADDKLVEYAPVGADGKVIAKLYAQKHNPFVYFAAIQGNAQRMARIVPYEALTQDLSSSQVPDLVWISPDQCHDMHGVSPESAAAIKQSDCGYPASGLDHGAIRLGDAYLKEAVAAITGSPAWKEGSALVIVWDEDDYAGFSGTGGSPVGRNGTILGGARAPLILVTAGTAPAARIDEPLNHYDLLAALESIWGLGCLENSCHTAWTNPVTAALR